MTGYAPLPGYAVSKPHPRTLALIIAGHAVLIAAVMTARMDLPIPFVPTTTQIDFVPLDPIPPDNPPPPQPRPDNQAITHTTTIIPIPTTVADPFPIVPTPDPIPNSGPVGGSGAVQATPPAEPVRFGPRFITPELQIRPPYPQSKLRMGEEAVLKLKLEIDANGRVTSVEPVGKADPAFLEAARRHLIAHWRYKPATEDGQPVATSTVITLRFELQD